MTDKNGGVFLSIVGSAAGSWRFHRRIFGKLPNRVARLVASTHLAVHFSDRHRSLREYIPLFSTGIPECLLLHVTHHIEPSFNSYVARRIQTLLARLAKKTHSSISQNNNIYNIRIYIFSFMSWLIRPTLLCQVGMDSDQCFRIKVACN